LFSKGILKSKKLIIIEANRGGKTNKSYHLSENNSEIVDEVEDKLILFTKLSSIYQSPPKSKRGILLTSWPNLPVF
jgi:hypothetical protein